MSTISKVTQNFLDAVMDPFGHETPTLCPDRMIDKMICFRDYNNNPANNNLSAVNIIGCMIVGRYGANIFCTSNSNSPSQLYGFELFYIISDGTIQLDTSTNSIFITPTNLATITGSSTSYDPELSMLTNIRLFSMGLRVWPSIEQITDSSTLAITTIQSGSVSWDEVFRCFQSGSSVFNLVSDLPHLKTYSNNEGSTVRYNPFMLKEQLFLQDPSDFIDDQLVGGDPTDSWRFPFCLIRFTTSVATLAALPFRFQCVYWMDGALNNPTPIMGEFSPVDIEFDQVASMMSREAAIRVSTSGHTFPPLASYLPSIISAARSVAQGSSHIISAAFKAAKRSGQRSLGNMLRSNVRRQRNNNTFRPRPRRRKNNNAIQPRRNVRAGILRDPQLRPLVSMRVNKSRNNNRSRPSNFRY